MKSSTYGFFVMLAFLSQLGEGCDSINELIKLADGIARDMGCKSKNLSPKTKYTVIGELEKDGLIVLHRKHSATVKLKNNVKEFVVEWSWCPDNEEDDKE